MNDQDPPGPLISSGRTSDVFDIGGGRVLRRYHAPRPDVEGEVRVMELVRSHGYPVPEVFSVDGRDLVMARIDGPTMFDDIRRRPVSLLSHTRRLARLQQRLADIPAPDWLMAPGWTPDPAGDRVLHLDLHPMNVLLAADGPVVIDWTNAAAGPPGFDAAMTYVVMSTFDLAEASQPTTSTQGNASSATQPSSGSTTAPSPSAARGSDLAWRAAQRLLVEMFRRYRGRTLVAAYLGAACDHRLADPHLTPGERVAVAALRKRARA